MALSVKCSYCGESYIAPDIGESGHKCFGKQVDQSKYKEGYLNGYKDGVKDTLSAQKK